MTPPPRAAILLVDKPPGPTSHDLVARARRATGVRRIGHAGTLDPFASGLLILLIGRATRLARYFAPLEKTYEAVARLGARSSTGDPDGEIVETGVVAGTLALPSGTVRQRPPAYSAVRVGGERAYARARRGEQVETPEREVTVHDARLLWRSETHAGLRFVCSSGTYVRSLVEALGGDAYCAELRRLAIGPFTAAGAWPGEGTPAPIGIVEAWRRFAPVLALAGAEAADVAHGRPIAPRGQPGPLLLVDEAGDELAVAAERDGSLRVEVGLRGE